MRKVEGWWVFAVALGVRLAYLATARGPAFDEPLIDADYYDFLGARLAEGLGFPPGPFWQPPLYPLFLGGLYGLVGHTLWAPRLVQALLGAATAALCFHLALRLTRQVWAARVAGLLVALHGPLVFYDGELLATSLATFLGTLALWLATSERPTPARALVAGAVVGLGALAVAPLLLLAAPVAWAFASGRSWRPVLSLLATLAVLLPVTLTNQARSGELILISANGGINLWIGNNPDMDRAFAIRPGRDWEELVAEPERHGLHTPAGQDRYFVNKALGWCAARPMACLRNLGWKARLLLLSRELPRNEDLYVLREQSPVLEALTAHWGGAALPYVLLWPLAVVGVGVVVLRPERERRLVLAAALVLAAPCVLFFVTGRYRAPLAPVLCVLAALGLAELSALRSRARAAVLLGALGTLALAVWPVELAVDRVDFQAELHYVVGGRRARLGDDAGAVEAWRKALERQPGYLEAGYNLGLALQRLGRHQEAARSFEALLTHHPGWQPARQALAEARRLAGGSEEASPASP
ncbi:MAG TPA: glycosyltransferase family 39 protein [Myxococcaceae bacterium]|nr:glycosyltransferase family 39 protein [Myxococcaceae bacterium]